MAAAWSLMLHALTCIRHRVNLKPLGCRAPLWQWIFHLPPPPFAATVQKAFRGQEPYIVLCAHMSEIANINRAVAMLTENLRAVGKISLVLLEGVCDNPDVFLNRALTVKESVTVNPAMLQLADRPLITKKQQYSVWVIHTTTASRLTRA